MITARIVGAGLEPVNDSFVEFPDGQDDRFDDLEQQAAEIAASGIKCAIHWHRRTDGQSGYWGPKGVSMQPQWFSPKGRPPLQNDERKDARIELRVRKSKKAAWQAKADDQGLSLNEWIEKTLDTVKKHG